MDTGSQQAGTRGMNEKASDMSAMSLAYLEDRIDDNEDVHLTYILTKGILDEPDVLTARRFLESSQPRRFEVVLSGDEMGRLEGQRWDAQAVEGEWFEVHAKWKMRADHVEGEAAVAFLRSLHRSPETTQHCQDLVGAWLSSLRPWATRRARKQAPRTRVLSFTALDVGAGDAAILDFPEGTRWLVDCNTGTAQKLPQHGVMRGDLGAILISHPHWDHCADLLKVVAQSQPKCVLVADNLGFQFSALWIAAVSISYGVPVLRVPHGETRWVDGCRVSTAHLPSGPGGRANRLSIVLAVRAGDTLAVLAGDLESGSDAQDLSRETERLLATAEPINKVLYKACHHGSDNGAHNEMLSLGRRSYSAVSSRNRYRHPRVGAIAALGAGQFCRTDAGRDIWVGGIDGGAGWVIPLAHTSRGTAAGCAGCSQPWCQPSATAPGLARCQGCGVDGHGFCAESCWTQGRC